MNVSPLTIEIMLACYVSPDPSSIVGAECWVSKASQESRSWLHDAGLIDDEHKATNRGSKWVELLCTTPLPIQKWIDPREEQK